MSELTKSVNAAIKAADSAQVAELVINATEKERRELRKEITDSWWHQLDNRKRGARLLARCGSATARQVASEWWTFSFSQDAVAGSHLPRLRCAWARVLRDRRTEHHRAGRSALGPVGEASS